MWLTHLSGCSRGFPPDSGWSKLPVPAWALGEAALLVLYFNPAILRAAPPFPHTALGSTQISAALLALDGQDLSTPILLAAWGTFPLLTLCRRPCSTFPFPFPFPLCSQDWVLSIPAGLCPFPALISLCSCLRAARGCGAGRELCQGSCWRHGQEEPGVGTSVGRPQPFPPGSPAPFGAHWHEGRSTVRSPRRAPGLCRQHPHSPALSPDPFPAPLSVLAQAVRWVRRGVPVLEGNVAVLPAQEREGRGSLCASGNGGTTAPHELHWGAWPGSRDSPLGGRTPQSLCGVGGSCTP